MPAQIGVFSSDLEIDHRIYTCLKESDKEETEYKAVNRVVNTILQGTKESWGCCSWLFRILSYITGYESKIRSTAEAAFTVFKTSDLQKDIKLAALDPVVIYQVLEKQKIRKQLLRKEYRNMVNNDPLLILSKDQRFNAVNANIAELIKNHYPSIYSKIHRDSFIEILKLNKQNKQNVYDSVLTSLRIHGLTKRTKLHSRVESLGLAKPTPLNSLFSSFHKFLLRVDPFYGSDSIEVQTEKNLSLLDLLTLDKYKTKFLALRKQFSDTAIMELLYIADGGWGADYDVPFSKRIDAAMQKVASQEPHQSATELFQNVFRDATFYEDLEEVDIGFNKEMQDKEWLATRIGRDCDKNGRQHTSILINNRLKTYQGIQEQFGPPQDRNERYPQDQAEFFTLLQMLAVAEYELVPVSKIIESWMALAAVEQYPIKSQVRRKKIIFDSDQTGRLQITYDIDFALYPYVGAPQPLNTQSIRVSYEYTKDQDGSWHRSQGEFSNAAHDVNKDEHEANMQLQHCFQDATFHEDLQTVNAQLDKDMMDSEGRERMIVRDFGDRRNRSSPILINNRLKREYQQIQTEFGCPQDPNVHYSQDQAEFFALLQTLSVAEYEGIPMNRVQEAWRKQSLESNYSLLTVLQSKEITIDSGKTDRLQITYDFDFILFRTDSEGKKIKLDPQSIRISYEYTKDENGKWHRSQATWVTAAQDAYKPDTDDYKEP